MSEQTNDVRRWSDAERVDWTPCCGAEFRGAIVHGDRCAACGEVMLWCRGCGSGDGSEYKTCDRCGVQICVECEPDRDDDAPIDLCSECCDVSCSGLLVESR